MQPNQQDNQNLNSNPVPPPPFPSQPGQKTPPLEQAAPQQPSYPNPPQQQVSNAQSSDSPGSKKGKLLIIIASCAAGLILLIAGLVLTVSVFNESSEEGGFSPSSLTSDSGLEEQTIKQTIEQGITDASGGLITVEYVVFGLDGLNKYLSVGLVAEETPPTTEQMRQVLKTIRASYPDDAAYLHLSFNDAQGELIDISDQLIKIGVEEIDIVNGYMLSIRSSGLQQLSL